MGGSGGVWLWHRGYPVGRTCTGTPTTITSGPTGGPCDIYAADGGPCIAAHSTVRALYAAYDGPLYQVKKTADGTTMDIGRPRPRRLRELGRPGRLLWHRRLHHLDHL